jgi:alpha-beta hydrolase superfamily lysophospholipase
MGFMRGVVAGVAVAMAAACGWLVATSSGSPPAPRGNVYEPPRPLTIMSPGTLIWAQKVPLPLNPPATVWRILYHSRSLLGKDIAVSGFAVIPTSGSPGGKRAVYAWAHGSVGQADRCAPSRQLMDNLPPYGGQLVARGIALVATDYEGVGTPGEPTPYVGVSEGHAVLDSVRAIKQLPRVGRLGPIVIAGHSQGGGAALWAAEISHSYARELDVRGVVALAPAAQLTTIIKSLTERPYKDYLGEVLWAIDGLKAAYGRRLDFSAILTKAARSDLPRVAHQCGAQTVRDWYGKSLSAVFTRNPLSVPWLVRVLSQNSPGHHSPRLPMFLGQGDQDQQITVSVSAQLKARYCRLGVTVIRHVYPGVNHDGVVDAASSDALAWIADRLAGRPAPSDC